MTTFSGTLAPPDEPTQRAGIEVSRRLRAHHPRPQLPHGDYVGHADSLARLLGIPVDDPDWRGRNDIAVPSCYRDVGGSTESSEVEAGPGDMRSTIAELAAGKLVATAVFRALQGRWSFFRVITSHRVDMASGSVTGEAEFQLRPASTHPQLMGSAQSGRPGMLMADGDLCETDNGLDPLYSWYEYLYLEKGVFQISTGSSFDVTKMYVYAYDTDRDALSVYFSDDGSRANPFVSLSFTPGPDGWTAMAEPHLCGDDVYHCSYRMVFAGLGIKQFEVEYRVTGPYKDYISRTTFSRPLT